jgi:pimeloyl-ACP methyl ester carboxylesterase
LNRIKVSGGIRQEPPTDGKADRRQVIDQTIEVRRAIDLLLLQPEVDPKRVGYVGHDYGAMYGSIVAGHDKRVKAYVLIAGMGNFGDWSLKYCLLPACKAQKRPAHYERVGSDSAHLPRQTGQTLISVC